MEKKNPSKSPQSRKILDKETIEEETFEEEILYLALGHEIRRHIIKIIGNLGFAGFSDLKKSLQVSTGTIYHHLDVLSKLIVQDEKKKYHLSPLGMHGYSILQKNIDTISSMKVEEKALLDEKLKPWQQWILFQPFF